MTFDEVVALLHAENVRFALIGAVALAARGAARSTQDIDLLTAERRVLDSKFWKLPGVDVRKGDSDDPLAGVVRIAGEEQIDVVVAKYKWQLAVIERSPPVFVRGMELAVPEVRDLILLKLFAGGYRDRQDIAQLLESHDRAKLTAEVTVAVADLPEAMKTAWQRFLDESRP